jgi:hypothetical protein
MILFMFLGFMIGRLGDKYGGHLDLPHHWIYGLILMIVGIWYYNLYIFYFGLGCFISDFKDFIHLRFWGKDKPKVWKFWDID